MAKYVGFGIEEYITKLNVLTKKSQGMCKQAVYDGADIVADAIRASTEKLPVTSNSAEAYRAHNITGEGGVTITGVTALQKQGLLEGLGIAKMETKGGGANTSVGFHGYNKQKGYSNTTEKGQPNRMIAASVESGTSFRAKHPFVSPAIRRSRAAAEAAMVKRFEEEINKTMK